ncbi:glycosyl hydrolase family 61-domain-containing protein [Cyathus striatus]|nr:glycosyl hydrolase family 61-domain-containing protein [Cyathus striatus]
MRSSLAAFALFGCVSAHTIFQELWVNGVSQGHIVGIRVPDYDGPITDVTSNDVICNGGINPYHQPISNAIINITAGAQVTAEWHHTLSGAAPGDAADPIDPSHKGPVLAYLAKVPSATQSSVTGLQWFKIYHDGLTGTQWAVDKLIANKGKVSFAIPGCIPAGQYLLRVEIIALHGASTYPGAQLYMECAQINISGGGSTQPATVSFPGAYKGTDPGITINIYSNLASYTIPGPSVFTCSGNSSPAPTTSVPITPSTSVPVVVPSSTSQPTTPSSTAVPGTVVHYGQCGGLTYSGPTGCVAPYACVKSSDYVSWFFFMLGTMC